MDPKNNLPAVMVNQQQLKQGSCLQEASCPGSGHPHPDLIPLFKVLERKDALGCVMGGSTWSAFPGFWEHVIQTGPEGCLGLGCAKGNQVHLRRKSAPKDLGHLQDSQALSLGELSGDLALETSTIHRGSMQSFRDPGKGL